MLFLGPTTRKGSSAPIGKPLVRVQPQPRPRAPIREAPPAPSMTIFQPRPSMRAPPPPSEPAPPNQPKLQRVTHSQMSEGELAASGNFASIFTKQSTYLSTSSAGLRPLSCQPVDCSTTRLCIRFLPHPFHFAVNLAFFWTQ